MTQTPGAFPNPDAPGILNQGDLVTQVDVKQVDVKPVIDEPPPFLRTWPKVYRFALVYLAAIIFLFWLFTRHYAPPA